MPRPCSTLLRPLPPHALLIASHRSSQPTTARLGCRAVQAP
jgi:hypothetical protein